MFERSIIPLMRFFFKDFNYFDNMLIIHVIILSQCE